MTTRPEWLEPTWPEPWYAPGLHDALRSAIARQVARSFRHCAWLRLESQRMQAAYEGK